MSRLPVHYLNDGLPSVHKMQVPVYCFTSQTLEIFSTYSKIISEQFENIELLRFLVLGYKLKMSETKTTSIAVDVPSDIIKVENS